jgi:hypothetical protein
MPSRFHHRPVPGSQDTTLQGEWEAVTVTTLPNISDAVYVTFGPRPQSPGYERVISGLTILHEKRTDNVSGLFIIPPLIRGQAVTLKLKGRFIPTDK